MADNFYYRCELTATEREWLLKRFQGVAETNLTKAVKQALELAEKVDLPLVRVDWTGAEAAAQKGYSLTDQVFDGWNPLKWFGKGTE